MRSLLGYRGLNTDQGRQSNSDAFVERLKAAEVKISWDGRGRALGNVFVGRLWRSVKQEGVCLNEHRNVPEAYEGLAAYVRFSVMPASPTRPVEPSKSSIPRLARCAGFILG